MNSKHIDTLIADRVHAFVDDLRILIRQSAVEAVQEALGGAPSPAARKKARVARAAAKAPAVRKRGPQRPVRQAPAQVEGLAGQVLTYLKNNPNESISALAEAIGVATAELKRPIAVLLETNQVTKSGEGRATKYAAA